MDGKRYFGVLVVAALLGACLGGAVFGAQAAVENQKTKTAGIKPPSTTQMTTSTAKTQTTAIADASTTFSDLPIPTRTGFPTGSRPTGLPGGSQFPTDRPMLTPAQPVP